ncbi:MAG: N-acetylglucosamine-6-phosphate deacetylase [Erysipelotrichaceae bacterium]|nr:N-acetylglucosamine-6-phosphate deacetylase [Erysipelotrichaceae bacterium]
MKMIIYSDRIYMDNAVRSGYLEIENGKFVRFYEKDTDLKPDIDFGSNRIIPGIIDTHNHGCYGYAMSAAEIPTLDDVRGYLKGLASSGVTGVFPTTIHIETIKLLVDHMNDNFDGARILGIHSEGPWGARVGEKGVNTGYPSVDMEHAQKMLDAGQGHLLLIDIAPEVPGALEAIRFFVSRGVKVGAYHTNANYREANAGIDAGITVATHLGNVMTGLHHRDIGTLGACLFRPEVDCEVICDGLHVSLEMIKLYFKVKDTSRFMMVSDNVAYAGLPVGHYLGSASQQGNQTNGQVSDRKTIYVNEEGFVLSETGRLSGSSKPVLYGIRNLVEINKMPLEEVVKMSSLNPARKYGFGDVKGSIAVGKDADFVVIDDDYNALYTYCEGRKVYDRSVDTDLFNKEFYDSIRLDD